VPIFYLVKRVGVFFLIVWFAATVNFFLPRLGGENPVAQKIMQQAALGGNLHVGMQGMIKEYEEKFGLTKPLWRQYLLFCASSCRQTASGTATSSSPRVKRRGTARDPIRSPSASAQSSPMRQVSAAASRPAAASAGARISRRPRIIGPLGRLDRRP